ncbi:MAG: Mur ligase family protein [Candidatus Staskawiczbacteria bacterium]|nr:Mur ligase family protein [Candidatus Staskawiczbacteria bacterium]
MLTLLLALWLIWEIKFILFWLYLWQLKEYHIGRFVDHFRTHKGKKLLFSFTQILKLILLFFLFDEGLFLYVFYALFAVYFWDLALFARAVFGKSVKKPVWTSKTIFLSFVSFLAVFVFVFLISGTKELNQIVWVLFFDILTPVIISVIVLIFQPGFVAIRNKTLLKATEKMKKIRTVSGLKVIAITGSYGKTSTKEFLTTILSTKYKVLSTKEHQNSEIGVARAILDDLKPSHEIFIAEVGAYNKGKVKEVCKMLMPKMGVVTGVNQQHMALFGSMDNLLSAEGGGELLESLPEDGTIFVNGENKYCLELVKKSNKLPPEREKIYALENEFVNADIWSEDVEVFKEYISFIAKDKKNNLSHFNVKVLGKQNAENLLGAILVASELEMSFEEISEAVKHITHQQGGMVLKRGKHDIDIIDASYSSNPDGVIADLEYLKVFSNKKAIIMPCLIELGGESGIIHEKLGKKIGEVCDLAIITSKDYFKEIKRGFNSHACLPAGRNKKIVLCEKPHDAYLTITTFLKSGDAVLLEGRVPKKLIDLLSL